MQMSCLKQLCQKLQVVPGETTADGEFTVIASECLAACDRAPMMLVDDKVVGPSKRAIWIQFLAEAKKGQGILLLWKSGGQSWLKCAF